MLHFNGCDVHVDPKRACRLLGVSNQEEMLGRDSNVLDRRVRYAAYFAEYFARLMQLPGSGTRALAVDLGGSTDSRPLGSGPVSIKLFILAAWRLVAFGIVAQFAISRRLVY